MNSYKRNVTIIVFNAICFAIASINASEGDLDGPAITSAGSNFSYVIHAESEADEIKKNELKISKITNPAAEPPIDFEISSIVSWEIKRSNTIISATLVSKSGNRDEMWKTDNTILVKNHAENSYYVHKLNPFGDSYAIELGKYGYCHGSWITPEFYVGKVKLDGKEALYFCNPKPPPGRSQAFTKIPPNASQAWIDPDTRKPLCIKEDHCTYRYTHLPPVALSIPKGAEDALKKEQLRQALIPIPHHP